MNSYILKTMFSKARGFLFEVNTYVLHKYTKFVRLVKKIAFALIRRNIILSMIFVDRFKKRSVRLYLKKNYTLIELFKELERKKINYSVLRWFEELPFVEEGEDIDMLVSSLHLDDILMYFTPFEKAGGQKFDIYPSGYHLSMNYRNLSYYPELIADKILENTVIHNGLCKVPNNHYYPLSFIFHIVFHKACKSSFTYEGVSHTIKPEHDYPGILEELVNDNIASLKCAYDYLSKHNFLPSIDTAKKYADSAKSADLKRIIAEVEATVCDDVVVKGDSVMFVVREKLLEYPCLYKKFLESVKSNGFEIVTATRNIPAHFSSLARGNNWDKGPWPVSGGEPAEIIVAYNRNPTYKTNEVGFEQDVTIKSVKNYVRKETEKSLPYWKQFNGIHTTDNMAETLEYASYISESFYQELILLLNTCNEFSVDNYHVIADMTRFGRRAKVYKIKYNNEYAILKVFSQFSKRYFERELDFYKIANDNMLNVPKLYEFGDNFFITQYISGSTKEFGVCDYIFGSGILDQKSEEFIKYCHKLGYFNADFLDFNHILTDDGDVVFFDFEYMQKYDSPVDVPFEYSGIIEPEKYDLPLGYEKALYKQKLKRWFVSMFKGKNSK